MQSHGTDAARREEPYSVYRIRNRPRFYLEVPISAGDTVHSSSLDVNPPTLLGPAVVKPAGVGPVHPWLLQCPRLHFCSDCLNRKHSCPSDIMGSVMAGSSNHTAF